MQALYIGISIAAFIMLVLLLILNRRGIRRTSSLAMLGMTMVLFGIFIDDRCVGYSLIAVGVLISIIDAKYIKSHEQH